MDNPRPLPLALDDARCLEIWPRNGDREDMSRLFRKLVAAAFLAASGGLPSAAHAQPAAPDFGDDSSRWARDGECDDPRFEGLGMSEGLSLDDDIGHDASDCRTAWNVGDITIATLDASDAPDFGDDASDWANDGECDDPRFSGPGMTGTTLLDADIGHDATDCKAGFDDGVLQLIGDSGGDTPDFGNDDGEWSNDDECDDPRFDGEGMTNTTLLQEDILHDATDCRAAWDAGTIQLR
jgi:hypothetical protein